ncbi:MAG: hypothetical protein LBT09_01125 [Planctomycetaceae bacterium]|jgi:23S rRNA (cytosine1962-C5)-methyltransferase|nr:hypothetical protein [Planctomycetaceae bacterium]
MMFDYELIDFGFGYCLERFGGYLIERPSLSAVGVCRFDDKLWCGIDSSFVPDWSGGQRGKWTTKIDSWQIELGQILLELRCTPFGHVGFFAEHVTNWLELSGTIAEVLGKRELIRVLNLFAYTGGASITAAKSAMLTREKISVSDSFDSLSGLADGTVNRVEVVHVDSAGNVVSWARRNAELNGVFGVRFIVEDVRKFVVRELRRGNFYDVVILDPPTYGHGVRGESWKFSVDLQELLCGIVGLLSERPVMIILTAHTEGCDPDVLGEMLQHAGLPKSLKIKKFQMQIKTKNGKSLTSGYGIIASIYNS